MKVLSTDGSTPQMLQNKYASAESHSPLLGKLYLSRDAYSTERAKVNYFGEDQVNTC